MKHQKQTKDFQRLFYWASGLGIPALESIQKNKSWVQKEQNYHHAPQKNRKILTSTLMHMKGHYDTFWDKFKPVDKAKFPCYAYGD